MFHGAHLAGAWVEVCNGREEGQSSFCFFQSAGGSSLTFLNLAMVPSLIVANKKDRIERVKCLSGVTERGRITSSEAATLHGQLNFAQGNAMVVLCNLQ